MQTRRGSHIPSSRVRVGGKGEEPGREASKQGVNKTTVKSRTETGAIQTRRGSHGLLKDPVLA